MVILKQKINKAGSIALWSTVNTDPLGETEIANSFLDFFDPNLHMRKIRYQGICESLEVKRVFIKVVCWAHKPSPSLPSTFLNHVQHGHFSLKSFQSLLCVSGSVGYHGLISSTSPAFYSCQVFELVSHPVLLSSWMRRGQGPTLEDSYLCFRPYVQEKKVSIMHWT